MSKFNLAKKLQPATKAWKSFKTHLQSKLRHPKFVRAVTSLRQRCRYVIPFLHRKFLAITKRRPPSSTHHLYHHHHHFYPSVSAIYVDELFPQTSTSQEASRKKQDMAGSSNGAPSDTFKRGLVTVSPKNEKIQAHNNVGIKFRVEVAKDLGEKKEKSKDEESSKNSDQWKVPLVPKVRGIDEDRPGEFKLGFQNIEKVGVKFPKKVPKESTEGKGKTKNEENSKKCGQWNVPSIPKFRGIDERAEEFIAKVRQDMKLEREQSIIEFEEMLKRSA